jgi:kumamolisin
MSKFTEHVPLSGSERVPMAGAKAMGPANPGEQLQVTVLLKSKATREARQNAIRALASQAPAERKHLTRAEFAGTRGAAAADVEKVTEFAHEYGLSVVRADAARRSVVLAGTVATFSRAFQVDLYRFEHATGSYRGRTGAIHIPQELSGVITAVLGLDNRPQATPHFRTKKRVGTTHARTAQQQAGTFTPPQVGSLYDYPAGETGKGECIALIELGGGYRARDIQHYFKSVLKVTPPKVTAISVDGGQNSPTGNGDGPDGEVMLDIEVAGGVAQQANIAVYFTPNTDQGFYDAISTTRPTTLRLSRSAGEARSRPGANRRLPSSTRCWKMRRRSE